MQKSQNIKQNSKKDTGKTNQRFVKDFQNYLILQEIQLYRDFFKQHENEF